MKNLFLLIFFILISFEIHAQNWRPNFAIPLGSESMATSNNQKLNEYLEQHVPWHRPGNCESELSVFTFRVNSRGGIDSMDVDGNLNKDVAAQIVKNIYKTEGKWKIPDNTKAGDKCWFVYPFFLFGNISPCTDEKRAAFYQLLSLYHIYSGSFDIADNRGRVILAPNSFAKLSEK
ncbi:MAG: hypothetical protein ABIN24_05680 [Dyadobacter sp.]